jgi:methyltransferase family protein
VTANVEPPADILMDGGVLPVPDKAYDIVTSLDTLEHVPRPERPTFVSELVRVTARRLILCCPFGTTEHTRAEEQLLDWYERLTGERHRWLAEHVENGLPGDQELRPIFQSLARAEPLRIDFRYHGDFRSSQVQFKETVNALRGRPGAKLALAWRWLPRGRNLQLSERPTQWTNRVFVTLERAGPG